MKVTLSRRASVVLHQGALCALILMTLHKFVLNGGRYPKYHLWGDDPTLDQEPTGPETCPLKPSTLRGASPMDLISDPPTEEEIVSGIAPLGPGGSWSPQGCVPSQRVAIIIPYRDRALHLRHLLSQLHPLLQRQLRQYTIFLAEQAYNDTYNKGKLMNVAFRQAMMLGDWDCVIFHDVDMVPENDRNLYMCGKNPRHLSPSLDEMRYILKFKNLFGGVVALTNRIPSNVIFFSSLKFKNLFGGVVAFTPKQFRDVNGYSNDYWGWGGEDDDMWERCIAAGYKVTRPSSVVGRYKMVQHRKRKPAKDRYSVLIQWGRWPYEGLASLDQGLYHDILKIEKQSLYTHILVDVGPSANKKEYIFYPD